MRWEIFKVLLNDRSMCENFMLTNSFEQFQLFLIRFHRETEGRKLIMNLGIGLGVEI